MKCVAGVATENFCRFGKNIYKSHTQKMHTHTHKHTNTKQNACVIYGHRNFLFSQRNCQMSDIHLPSVPGERQKKHKGECKKNANKIINLLKCSRSSSSSACSGSSSSSKAKIHFHVRAMEFTCKFKKPEHSALSHTHTQTHIHIDRQTCICRQCVSVWHIWHIAASVLQRHFWFCWNIKMDGTHTYNCIWLTGCRKRKVWKIHIFSADKYLLNRFIICCTIS